MFASMLTCSECKINCDFFDLKNHYSQYHSNNGRIPEYKCPKCDRSYNFFSSFKEHWLNKHVNENASNINEIEPSNVKATTSKSKYSSMSKDDVYSPSNAKTEKVVTNSANESIANKKEASDSSVTYNPNETEKKQQLLQSLKNNVIEKYMKLEQSSSLSEKYLQNFVSFAKEIVISGCQIIEDESNSLNDCNTCVNSQSIVDLFPLSFDEFDTAQKRQCYLKKKGDYIPPVKYTIGIKSQRIKRTATKKLKKYMDKAYGYFFPLRRIFKKVFELPNVYDTVFAYKKKLEDENSVISNFVQSQVWKEKIKKFNANDVLPLFLFIDDYETGKALGSHAKENKLAGTYVSIPCFPPEYQSNFSSIFQALLYYSQDRVRFGNYSTFRKLIEELTFLEEEGIELDLPQGKVKIFFKLALILGDNLGLHALLGFVESFNANFMCRFRKMDKFERSLAGIEDKDYMRSKENYEKDARVGDVSFTGIKEECVFHNLQDFHVTENFSVDLMHDFLEGVCHFDMAALLNFYITEKKCFSLDDLNNRMSTHDWGTAQFFNIPPPILEEDLKNDNMRVSASEILTFVRHFGILVGDLVNEDDPCWQVYLSLCKILDIITSPTIQPQCVIILENVIQEHHLLLRNVLKRNLKPKDHFLIHFPTIMRESGPLVNLWCMRMESINEESLKFISSSNCKKNVCLTIAKKHQMKLAAILFEKKIFLPLKIGPSKECLFTDLNVSFCDSFSKDKHYRLNRKIRVANWVEKNGNKYKPGMVLCLSDDDNFPVFGIINYIFFVNEQLLFIYSETQTIWRDHEHAYEILKVSAASDIIMYEKLLQSRPLSSSVKFDRNFIVLRTCL